MKNLPFFSAVALSALFVFSCGKETQSTIVQTVTDYPPKITVSRFASGFSRPAGVVIDSAGNLFVVNLLTGVVNRITPSGVVGNFASAPGYASGIAIGPGSYVYVSFYSDGTVKRVPPGGGTMSTYVSNLSNPSGLCFDSQGNLYIANHNSNTVQVVSPTGVDSVFASGFAGPVGLVFDGTGSLYVANRYSNSISKVTKEGTITTYAHDIAVPHSLAFDTNADLYVSESGATLGSGNSVAIVTAGGFEYQLSDAFFGATGLAFDAAGALYVANIDSGYVNKVVIAR
jgi:sugar lactone lactonase YvrE